MFDRVIRLSARISILGAVSAAPILAQQVVPTPESVLGFQVGDDFRLADYDESMEYFRQLDAGAVP